MKRFNKTLALSLVSWGILANNASALITIETVPVGNAGNDNDPTTGYGAVGYDYNIGKFEVTLDQYTAFLNAVGATDTYGLYNTRMATDPYSAGISRSGASGSYTYSVIGSGARPVAHVSWYDSARFVNWLHNGQPIGLQAAGTTETGAYTLNGNSGLITRNANATYGLPSENEWYKAAYHQPAAQGGDADNYWLYPTASNDLPNSRNGSTSDPNSANFYRDDGLDNGFNGGFAVNNSIYIVGAGLTDVGAFSLADSFYGTFDQGGNVWEWNDAVFGLARGVRGGTWGNSENFLLASFPYGNSADPANEELTSTGFRVVLVPEPSVIGLMALGMALLAWKRKRTL
jgi:formylglycine-generating enzyme